jgi:hypothetical protein
LNPENENQEEEEEEEDIEVDENSDEVSSDENEEGEDEDDVSESEEDEEVETVKTNKKSHVKHTTPTKSTNKQRTTRPVTRLTPAQQKIGAKTTKTKTSSKKRSSSNTSTKGPTPKKVNYILNEDADEISVGTCVSGFSRKRYLIAPNYYIQVGDVDFGKNGGLMEALYIVKMKTNTSEEFRSHIPARLIPHLREGLTVLLDEDNTNNSG